MKKGSFCLKGSQRGFWVAIVLLIGLAGTAVFSKSGVAASASGDEKELIRKATLSLNKKDYVKAEELLKEAWIINPQSSDTCVLWLRLYGAQRKMDLVEKTFKKAIALNPSDDAAYAEMGIILRQTKDLAGAKEYFKKALSLNPKNKEAISGSENLEADEYKTALNVNPKDESAAVKLGFWYIQKEKVRDAEGIFLYVLRINPRNDNALAGMGWVTLKRKDIAKAREFFSRALEINPRNKPAIKGMAQFSPAASSPSV